MPIEKQRLTFISYSRADKEFALQLARELRSSGFRIWLDQLDIPTGARWDDEVEKALTQCEIFMVILTPRSIASNNVKDEIGYAIDSNKRIMPLLLENANVPFRLRRFQYVDFTSKSHKEGIEAAKQLLRNLLNEPAPEMQSEKARRMVEGTSAQDLQKTPVAKDAQIPSLRDQLLGEIENPDPKVRLKAIEQLARLLESPNPGFARFARETLARIERYDDSRTVSRAAFQALAVKKAEEARGPRKPGGTFDPGELIEKVKLVFARLLTQQKPKAFYLSISLMGLLVVMWIALPQLVFLSSNSSSEQQVFSAAAGVKIMQVDLGATSSFVNGIAMDLDVRTSELLQDQPCQVIAYFQRANGADLKAPRSFMTMISPYIAKDERVSVYTNFVPSYSDSIWHIKLFMPYFAIGASDLANGKSYLEIYIELYDKDFKRLAVSSPFPFIYTR